MYDERGSIWRKWDLHVHTPHSYEENFGDDWDAYVRQLKVKAEEHGISVMGVTDYFSVDGYEKLVNEYEPLGEPSLRLDNGGLLYLIPKIRKEFGCITSHNFRAIFRGFCLRCWQSRSFFQQSGAFFASKEAVEPIFSPLR